jgi:hypothetical protein
VRFLFWWDGFRKVRRMAQTGISRQEERAVIHSIAAVPYGFRNSSGGLAMPAAIRRAALRVNNLDRDRRPTPSP